MKNLIKKYPNISYFTLAFGWTWILVISFILLGGKVDVSNPSPVFPIVGMLCNISPTVAAFLITRILKGREGVQELLARFKMKSSYKWIVLTVLTVPAVTILTTLISNFTIRKYEFGIVVPAIIMGVIWPLFSGFGEEFGWRGYILPQLLSKYSPLKSGIILGIIWEIWHIPMHYMAYESYGSYMIPAFLVIGFINLTLHSVIMTNIFVKCKGNLRLMVLYHATITGSAIVFSGFFQAEALPKYVVYEGIVSVSIFMIVAAILNLKRISSDKKVVKSIGSY